MTWCFKCKIRFSKNHTICFNEFYLSLCIKGSESISIQKPVLKKKIKNHFGKMLVVGRITKGRHECVPRSPFCASVPEGPVLLRVWDKSGLLVAQRTSSNSFSVFSMFPAMFSLQNSGLTNTADSYVGKECNFVQISAKGTSVT
jgi:hypothetical protein